MIRFFDPKTEFDFIGKAKYAVLIALAIPLANLLAIWCFGINWGIDFSGGTELQVKFQHAVDAQDIRVVLEHLEFSKNQVQRYGAADSNEMLIRVEQLSTFSDTDVKRINQQVTEHFAQAGLATDKIKVSFNISHGDRLIVSLPVPDTAPGLSVEQHQQLVLAQQNELAQFLNANSGFHVRKTKGIGENADKINDAILRDEPKNGVIAYNVQFVGLSDKIGEALSTKFGAVDIRKVEFVDSQVSKQLRTDGLLGVIYALLAMLIYIAIRFDLLFAPGAVVGLIHDTLGALMVFSFFRYEFDLPSVAALLTIVGYSINSTVVIYDRIRELVPSNPRKPLEQEEVRTLVNRAVNETFSRTINSSMTTLFTAVALWLVGGAVLQSFALTLTIGIILGAFASTFIAPVTYLFLREHFSRSSPELEAGMKKQGFTRSEKEKGVV